jgi:hypothetical protein
MERGLLGFAFAPDYPISRLFYVNVTNLGGDTQIRRYRTSGSHADAADTASMQVILTFAQVQSNHNSGWIGFDDSGLLYIATGDGGGDQSNLTAPIAEYLHGSGPLPGNSATGGYVYRVPVSLQGYCVYGDFASNNIWSLEVDALVPGETLIRLPIVTGPTKQHVISCSKSAQLASSAVYLQLGTAKRISFVRSVKLLDNRSFCGQLSFVH